MKFQNCLLIASLACLSVAADRRYPCYYPTKNAKLQQCATAKKFCSQVLDGSPPYTRTVTERSTTYIPSSTETSVSTSTTTETSTTISTSTSIDRGPETDSCGRPTAAKVLRSPQSTHLAPRAIPSTSCGLRRNANPSAVAGACSCYLQVVTTTTVVVPRKSGVATTTESTTTTSITTSVSVVATAIRQGCRSSQFSLAPSSNQLLVSIQDGGPYFWSNAFGSTFQIVDGYLTDYDQSMNVNLLRYPNEAIGVAYYAIRGTSTSDPPFPFRSYLSSDSPPQNFVAQNYPYAFTCNIPSISGTLAVWSIQDDIDPTHCQPVNVERQQ